MIILLGHLGRFTKTPYLVLFILLGAVGVGAASALATITLAGNVVITDGLTVDTDSLVVDSANDMVGVGTLTPSEKLDVSGHILGIPILGKWGPNSPTSFSTKENVIFDIEHENTNPAYFGFMAPQDHIKILKPGWYKVTAHVLTEQGSSNEESHWTLIHEGSLGGTVDILCKNFPTFQNYPEPIPDFGISRYQNSCSAADFFNADEKVVLENTGADFSIFGDSSGEFTYVAIERLN